MVDSKGCSTKSDDPDHETNVIHTLDGDKRNNFQIYQSYLKAMKVLFWFKMKKSTVYRNKLSEILCKKIVALLPTDISNT
jgi:hypothetical protein